MRASLSMWQLRQQVGGVLIKRERTDHSELTGSRRSSSLHFCIHSQKCRSSAEIAPFPRMLSFGGRFGCRIHSPSKVTFSVFVLQNALMNSRPDRGHFGLFNIKNLTEKKCRNENSGRSDSVRHTHAFRLLGQRLCRQQITVQKSVCSLRE